MSAYQDDGQWRWRRQIRVRGETKRGSGTPPINTKRAALQAEHEWIEAQLSGRADVVESPTLAAVADAYLAHVQAHRSESLWVNRISQVTKHLRPFFGRMKLDRITMVEIDRYKKTKLAETKPDGSPKYANATIGQQLLALSSLLRWAKDRGHLQTLPKIELLPPPADEIDGELEFITDAELSALLERTTGELRTMMLVAAHTGMRISELLSLRWADVDLQRGEVVVSRGSYRGKDKTTKGKRKRVVPLSRTAINALTAHRHERSPLVFCAPSGRRLAYDTMRRAANRRGLAGWHVLRHTFGTMLSARGVPLRAIQEWMGHRSINTTMIYASYSPVFSNAIYVLDGDGTWQPSANKTDVAADTSRKAHG